MRKWRVTLLPNLELTQTRAAHFSMKRAGVGVAAKVMENMKNGVQAKTPPNTAWSRLALRAAVIWWRATALILIAWHLFERLTQTVGRTLNRKVIMIKLTDVRIDAPSNTAHNVLCDIVAQCGIESVLLSLSEIVAAQQSVQSDATLAVAAMNIANILDVLCEDGEE